MQTWENSAKMDDEYGKQFGAQTVAVGGKQCTPGSSSMPNGQQYGFYPPQPQGHQNFGFNPTVAPTGPGPRSTMNAPMQEGYAPNGYNNGSAGYSGPPPPYDQKYLSGDTAVMEEDSNFMDFTAKSLRAGFIRKVFSLVLLQFLFTCGVIALFIFLPDVKLFVRKNPWTLFGSGIVVLVLTIVTYLWEQGRRRFPVNVILLGSLTLAYALLAASITVHFEIESVLYAAGATAAVCLSLILFSLQTKFKLSYGSGFLVTLLTLALVGGIFYILIKQGIVETSARRLVVSAIATVILSFVLIHDVKRITTGKHRFAISPEEYVHGSLAIYVDIIIIFIVILVVLGLGEKGSDCAGNAAGAGGGHHGGGFCLWCFPYGTSVEEDNRRARERDEDRV